MIDDNNQEIALEVKDLSRYKGGLRDPERTIDFINDDDIAQARKYYDEFSGGLLWVVNDQRLVAKYANLLKNAGMSRFRVIFIPSR